MVDKIDKRAIEQCASKSDAAILVDVRLKLLETIGVVNELAGTVADLQASRAAAIEDELDKRNDR